MRSAPFRHTANTVPHLRSGCGTSHVLMIDDSSHHEEALLNVLRMAARGIRPAFAVNGQEFDEQLVERNWVHCHTNEGVDSIEVIRMRSLLRRTG